MIALIASNKTVSEKRTVPFCSEDFAKSGQSPTILLDAVNQNSRPGRKPLLDEAKRRKICEVLAVGGTRTMAAAYVGRSLDTIARAAKRDPAFAKELRRASVECEIRCLRNLSKAAQEPKNWRAAAWMLERLWPERYGCRKHVGLTPRRSPRGRETAALAHHLGVPSTQAGRGRTRRKSARPRRPAARRKKVAEFVRIQPPRATCDQRDDGEVLRSGILTNSAPTPARKSVRRTPTETQNRPAETVKSSGKTRSSAPLRPVSCSAERVATPQNSRPENPEIIEKSAVFAAGPAAAAALAASATPQNHPPLGEKTPNPSRKAPPRLDELAQNDEKMFSGATPQNSPERGGGLSVRPVLKTRTVASRSSDRQGALSAVGGARRAYPGAPGLAESAVSRDAKSSERSAWRHPALRARRAYASTLAGCPIDSHFGRNGRRQIVGQKMSKVIEKNAAAFVAGANLSPGLSAAHRRMLPASAAGNTRIVREKRPPGIREFSAAGSKPVTSAAAAAQITHVGNQENAMSYEKIAPRPELWGRIKLHARLSHESAKLSHRDTPRFSPREASVMRQFEIRVAGAGTK